MNTWFKDTYITCSYSRGYQITKKNLKRSRVSPAREQSWNKNGPKRKVKKKTGSKRVENDFPFYLISSSFLAYQRRLKPQGKVEGQKEREKVKKKKTGSKRVENDFPF